MVLLFDLPSLINIILDSVSSLIFLDACGLGPAMLLIILAAIFPAASVGVHWPVLGFDSTEWFWQSCKAA
jgi:hypothetical protein